jgi:Lar family restriction alleviation protein
VTAIDLKPCPFCGCHDIDPEGWASTDSSGPACDNCGAGAGGVSSTLQENIEHWNRRAASGVDWKPIADAPQDGTRLMLWDSESKRPVFGSWRGDNPAITHFAAEPAGPEVA